jgi:hypothetical protein
MFEKDGNGDMIPPLWDGFIFCPSYFFSATSVCGFDDEIGRRSGTKKVLADEEKWR